jgi:FkbM family methyltransferase
VIKVTRNWYNIIPVAMGMRKQTVVGFRNGLRFVYAKGVFAVEQFLEQPYSITDVKGHDVVDVGAFNGDSAIYFAWKGAKRVFAFEPNPVNYRAATENIRLNGIQNIEIYNEAIGLSERELRIEEDVPGGNYYRIPRPGQSSQTGKSVRVRAFATFVNDFELEDAVLKMDCEGCEYEILPNIGDELLLPFDQIILEYHRRRQHGPDELAERLTKSGFEIKFLDNKGQLMQQRLRDHGLLYASRNLVPT